MDLLEVASVRWLYKHWLHDRWDGGAVEIAGTVKEGDEICGFEVKDFPGHAPGLIGLWRESDRVAIVTDTVYFADSERLKPLDYPNVPHRAFNWNTEGAARSVRKLAALDPALVCAGHDEPNGRPDMKQKLEEAADVVLGPARAAA
jgi:glyoxylase-like metal-dependent hydrolase (beta-lactamase superfamily II)